MVFFILIGLPTDGWSILQSRNAVIEPSLNSSVYLVLKVDNRLRFVDNGLNGILIQTLVCDVLIQGLSIVGGLYIQFSLDGNFLRLAIKLDIGFTLVVIGTSRSVSEVHISVDVEESLVILLIHTIFHVLPIGKGIAVDAVIEANGWRIGIYRREDKAVLTFYIGSVTALVEHITFSRNIACRSAIGIGEVDIMILLSFQFYRVFITTDYQSPIEVIANLMISALSDVE